MKRHRAAVLQDACTKQYDSAVEAARQFGHGELKGVFTAEERKRSRLDGGFEEDGRQRDDVEIVAAPEPAHPSRERYGDDASAGYASPVSGNASDRRPSGEVSIVSVASMVLSLSDSR